MASEVEPVYYNPEICFYQKTRDIPNSRSLITCHEVIFEISFSFSKAFIYKANMVDISKRFLIVRFTFEDTNIDLDLRVLRFR